MSTFLGLLTALGVAAWAVRWYMGQGDTTLQSTVQQLLARLRQTAPLPVAESPPLVPPEAAEQLMQPATPEALPGETQRNAQPISAAEGQEGEIAEEEEGKVLGYCPRCLTRREVADPSRTTTRKGKPAIRGHCAVCGTGMLVFEAGEEEPSDEAEPESTEEAPPSEKDSAES